MADIDLHAKLEAFTLEALAELEGAKDENDLRQWRSARLENSAARQALDKMKEASAEDRRKFEAAVNEANGRLETAFEARAADLRAKGLNISLEAKKPEVNLRSKLEALTLEALAELEGAKDENDLRQWRSARLENSAARQALDKMKESSAEERRKFEAAVNETRGKLEAAFESRVAELRTKGVIRAAAAEKTEAAGGDLLAQLEAFTIEAIAELEGTSDENTLQQWRTARLGKSSFVQQVFSKMKEASKEDRPKIGQAANKVRNDLEAAFEAHAAEIREKALNASLEQEKLDITLPGRRPTPGRLHPATQNMREILDVLSHMGFQTFRTPEVETDEYNFELLNIPPYHPARDMQDTFYTTDPNVVLRTHTSPGQIHSMRKFAPNPVRVALPGMCFRYEQISARHEIQFNQIELLVVGHNITFGDVKGTLDDFARRMFGENVRTRFRPSYFPFTEPSAEMDVECFLCGGKGCSMCKNSGWLEILGCGMIHPTVLQNGGYDPNEFSGWAAGMGPERITILRHHVDDIRNFWGNDIRFLEQF